MDGVERHRIGEIDVIVLEDGHQHAPNTLFPDHDVERAQAAATQAGIAYDGERSLVPIRGFVLRGRGFTAVVDAGSPPDETPTTGAFLASLAAAGVAPEEVTHLAMTHLHIDHVGGITDAAGQAVFTNAELLAGAGEWDHFTSPEVEARLGRGRALASFLFSQRAIRPYADRRRDVTGETEVLPGVSFVPLPGHTPGHSGIHLASGGEELLIWGDTIHCETFQMAEPDWGVLFDVDPVAARVSRRRIFDRVAQDGIMVTGPHVRGPGLRRVERMRQGYRLVPAE
ncbi:MBL fold metallo-hydrolase [Pseudooceanicola sp.]|uniref:MBL fold metallo-hydrolase n=1 Tax=Pseudooceanicola sp. TaxID=1914328 RepID=UPI004058886B